MATWRFGRGFADEELAAALVQADALRPSFDLDDALSSEGRWSRHHSEAVIARDVPGPPSPGDLLERAWACVRSYAFSDPRIVKAHFDPTRPLLGRPIILELQALGLHYLCPVVVGSVVDHCASGRTTRGFRYDTLEGHIERGCEWFVVSKDHASGEILFRIEAAWRPGELPNLWSRVGFALVGRRYQRAWHRLAHLRLRTMLASTGLEPLPRSARILHEGPSWPAIHVRDVARPASIPEIPIERNTFVGRPWEAT